MPKTSPRPRTQTIKVDYLARVEGEGALYIKVRNGQVQDVQLKIFEPPRFFEAFLRGRDFREAPDITARICGICPIAYEMSAINAMEDLLGLQVNPAIQALRRAIYCGEWIESHVLHIYMLHAPDFLGYQDAIQMAKDHPEVVKRGLRLKKIGNEIVRLLGGREIHPINLRVGGFYRVPTPQELAPLVEELKWAQDAALETVRWTGQLPFPDFERDYEFVALRTEDRYPLETGRIVSNRGLDIPAQAYDDHFEEIHVPYSNALHSRIRGRGAYHVGPLARYNLNFDRLSPLAQEAAREAGLGPVCRNPFQSIVVRSVEVLYAVEEALRILRDYTPPAQPAVEVTPRAGVGYGVSEAPRGILYHRYQVDEHGLILDAKIVPPTSQNQRSMEEDLWHFVPQSLHRSKEELTWQCEQAIRNYDPCISCATHFLKVHVEDLS